MTTGTGICSTLQQTGAGIGVFVQYLGVALPPFLIILGVIALVLGIGGAIVFVIKNSVTKLHMK